MDTVLIGGIGFLILAELFFLIKKVDNSSMNNKSKKNF